jgi:tetratricopeptide (TPR) repeat protein
MSLRTAAETRQEREMTRNQKKESIKEPTTAEEAAAMDKIFNSDPQRYLRIVNEWIDENPANSHAYFKRHFAWMKIGEPRRALEDLDKVIEVDPTPVSLFSRGEVYRHIGEYEKALADFQRGEAIDPKDWQSGGFGPLYQADVHARLGDEAQALACCARLPDHFWTPGVDGTPGGGKPEIADTLRRMAAEARRRKQVRYSRRTGGR